MRCAICNMEIRERLPGVWADVDGLNRCAGTLLPARHTPQPEVSSNQTRQQPDVEHRYYEFRFRTDRPANRDTIVLVCIRYTMHRENEREKPVCLLREVLTERGWVAFGEGEQFPGNLPEMSGLEVARDDSKHDYINGQLRHLERLMRENAPVTAMPPGSRDVPPMRVPPLPAWTRDVFGDGDVEP